MRPSSKTQTDGSVGRRVAGGAATVVLGLTMALAGGTAVPAVAADSAGLSGVVLGVGADETQRIVSWYSTEDTAQQLQVAPTAALVAGEFPAGAATFAATGGANITSSGGYNRHATVTGLKENTAYSYRVGSEGNWSPVHTFKTRDFEGDYDFLFLGDPQIGSSGNAQKDGAGWADTLKVATEANPDAELLVSGGDHVESANNEEQWTSFLAPEQLRQVPLAATIGNHDVGGKAYEQHHFTPNTDKSDAYYDKDAATRSGGDYWFIHKDVLFIDINSNAQSDTKDAQHVGYITDV
ncbi:metallophosphoesterase family protein, partial [Streptomyces althioticus]